MEDGAYDNYLTVKEKNSKKILSIEKAKQYFFIKFNDNKGIYTITSLYANQPLAFKKISQNYVFSMKGLNEWIVEYGNSNYFKIKLNETN